MITFMEGIPEIQMFTFDLSISFTYCFFVEHLKDIHGHVKNFATVKDFYDVASENNRFQKQRQTAFNTT